MSPSTKESAPKGAPATVARQLDRQPTYHTKQRIARGRPSVAHDLRARWPGRCEKCAGPIKPGDLIRRYLGGYRHAVCSTSGRGGR